jgi:hypothetical protein
MQMDILQLQLLEQEHQLPTFFNNKNTTSKRQEKNQSIKMCSKSERWESNCMPEDKESQQEYMNCDL